MPLPVRSLLAAAAVTAAAVAGGVVVGGSDDDEPAPPARTPFETTPLADFDTTGLVAERGAFCDRVDSRQVTAALGGTAAEATSWQSGDKIDVGNGHQDVAHEFGCRWTAADGTVAEAWVFAPPVGADQARELVKSAAQGPGCQVGTGPAFGTPSLALACTKDGVVDQSYRGLFGDGWLLCEVSRPAGATWDVVDRTGRWCVGVLEAAQRR